MTNACPTCGDEFDTKGGVKKHHYYKHDESIATESTSCNLCGSEFEYYPSNKDGLYCSDCVENKQYRHTPDAMEAEKHPRYRSKTVTCSNCDSEIEKTRGEIDEYDNHFCNNKCYGGWRSDIQKGEDNPNFVDGRSPSELYVGDWSKNKKKVLQRDDYSCQRCEKSKEEIGRNPDVHHKKPIREFDDLSKGHKTENLICLCPECHYVVEERGWSNGKTGAFHHE